MKQVPPHFRSNFESVLNDEEDVLKIKDMVLTVDEDENRDRMETAHMIFDGIVPVVLGHGIGFHLGVWDRLSEYMGVTNVYCDLYDRPEFLHACMRRITDATIAGIKQANALRIHDDITNTCHCSYIYTDKLLSDFGKGLGSTSENCWAMDWRSCSHPRHRRQPQNLSCRIFRRWQAISTASTTAAVSGSTTGSM